MKLTRRVRGHFLALIEISRHLITCISGHIYVTLDYRVFSRDVTAAMLLSLNQEMVPCWYLQLILCELNSVIRQTFPFVLVEKHAH